MWACGSDFEFQNADHWYRNLDKLVHYLNKNGTIHLLYSTPTKYVNAKHDETVPQFRLYEVVSLHRCVLPYKYRKIL